MNQYQKFAMQTVYENGVVLVDDNFTAIRVRSNL